MTNLLTQIWFCILLAGLIGGITGWFMRGGAKRKIAALQKQWKARYRALQQQNTASLRKLKQLNVIRHERDALNEKIKQMHNPLQERDKLKTQLHAIKQKHHQLNGQLTSKKHEVVALHSKLQHIQEVAQRQKKMVSKLREQVQETSNSVGNVEDDAKYLSLQAECRNLQEKRQDADRKLQESNGFIEQLMAQIEAKEEQIRVFQNQPAEPEHDLQDSLIQAHQEISLLREQLAEKTTNAEQQQERISKLEQELETQLEERDQRIQQQEEQLNRLDSNFKQAEAALQAKEVALQEMDSAHDESRIKMLDSDSKIKVLSEALEQEREANKQINDKLKLKGLRFDELQDEFDKKQIEFDALFEKLTATEYQLINAENQDSDTHSAQNQLESRSEEVQSRLQQELEASTHEVQQLHQRLEQEKALSQDLQRELEELRASDNTPGLNNAPAGDNNIAVVPHREVSDATIAQFQQQPPQPDNDFALSTELQALKETLRQQNQFLQETRQELNRMKAAQDSLSDHGSHDPVQPEAAPAAHNSSAISMLGHAQQQSRLRGNGLDAAEQSRMSRREGLERIEGITSEIASLLNKLGIHTVDELAKSQDTRLKGQIYQLKRRQRLVNNIKPDQIAQWIDSARKMNG